MTKSIILSKLKFFKADLIFLLIFIIFASFYYDSVLNKGPLNAHLWRQTDCLSITRCYSEGVSFFKPEMNIQLADNYKSGRTAGEFPILYFIVGMLWKLFGESYFIYRVFYLIILFTGLYSFFKSLKIIYNDTFWAIVISMLLFTSPVYVFYGVSFLTDAPAFSFILIALYYLLQYSRLDKKRLFYISMSFFALAGLLKISSLIAFVFLFSIFILESFSLKSLGNKKLFKCNIFEWVGFIITILTVFSWYYYAAQYNALHGFKYTFNNIYPIWLIKNNEITEIVKGIKNFTLNVFFSKSVLISLLLIGLINLFLWKKIPAFAYLSSIIIIIGSIIYFILWAPLMGIHDYYYIALLILFLGIILPFIWFIKTNHYVIFNSSILKKLVGIFLIFNFLYCVNVIKLKTLSEKGNYRMIPNREFVNLMKWTNSDAKNNWKRFESMKPYISKIGIKKEDLIISLPDKSFNISLFLVGQKGWTDYLNYNNKEDIKNLINNGAKYLYISDKEILKKEYLKAFLSEQIGSYEGIEIFKLSKNMLIY